jgi:plasmid stabilization system protein ParE
VVTKELIQTEIESLGRQDIEELYDLIKRFAQSKRQARKQSLMSKLKSIAIDAPEDFAANHDLYVIGEKCAEPNFR